MKCTIQSGLIIDNDVDNANQVHDILWLPNAIYHDAENGFVDFWRNFWRPSLNYSGLQFPADFGPTGIAKSTGNAWFLATAGLKNHCFNYCIRIWRKIWCHTTPFISSSDFQLASFSWTSCNAFLVQHTGSKILPPLTSIWNPRAPIILWPNFICVPLHTVISIDIESYSIIYIIYMLDKIPKQHTSWILFFDFQNITCYSESKCKNLYLVFTPCLE